MNYSLLPSVVYCKTPALCLLVKQIMHMKHVRNTNNLGVYTSITLWKHKKNFTRSTEKVNKRSKGELLSKLLRDNGPIYTRDGSSVWDELGQRTVVRLIIRLCINTGFQTDHPSRRTIKVVRLDRRTTVDNSSGRMIRLSV